MFGDIKALCLVLVIAAAVFAVARPICARYTEPADYNRRRNLWFFLTVLGFVSSSIWMYAVIAMPLMYVAGKRDRNPLALYMVLMFVIPNVSIALPSIIVGQLLDVSHLRMMSATILLPAVLRHRATKSSKDRWTMLEWLLLVYCALQIVVLVPYEAPTNTFRRSLLLFLDTFVVFYAFSRVLQTRAALREVVAATCLVGGLLAPLAIAESFKGWLLYQSIYQRWGIPDLQAWLLRGDALRAQVSTGHSLVLGYTVALTLGFWLYIQSQRARSMRDTLVLLTMTLGLLVSYSRGAWLMGILIAVAYLSLRPGAASFFAKVLPAIAVLGVVVYLSPLKEMLIDRLPIVGTADQDTIDYRRRFAEVSWALIKVHPLLGDPFVLSNMEELRQGQGIIDLINGYISVTLFYGFTGLFLFVSFFLLGLSRCYAAMRIWATRDNETMLLGAVLCAVMLGSLFFIATAGVGPIEYLLTGLMASYAATASPRTVGRPALRPVNANLRRAAS